MWSEKVHARRKHSEDILPDFGAMHQNSKKLNKAEHRMDQSIHHNWGPRDIYYHQLHNLQVKISELLTYFIP